MTEDADEKPKVQEHIPRLLHKRPQHNYTSSTYLACREEPEVLDPAIVQQYGERAILHAQQQAIARTADRAPDREALSLEQRMAEILRRARIHKIDMRRDVWVVRQMIDCDRTTQAKDRIRKMEARLDALA